MKWKVFFVWIVSGISLSSVALHTRKPCKIIKTTYGYVCENSDNYCDDLKMPEPCGDEYILVTSSKNKHRFIYDVGTFENGADDKNCSNVIEIDQSEMYQEIRGFGGAYTTTITNLVNDYLSPKLRRCFFKSYFSHTIGAAYTLLRIPIGGSDFDTEPWAYNMYPENDTNLSNFTRLNHRDIRRNAQIKEMMCVSKNQDVKILGGTWGPPKSWKELGRWGGGTDNQLKKEFYQAWADYHLRWINLMKEDNMNILAISTGNEPKSAAQITSQILSWNPDDQSRWIAKFLGPTLIGSNVEIHAFDENRDLAPDWLNRMKQGDEEAFDFVSAFDFHAYSDKALGPEYLDQLMEQYPDKEIWYTEMCFGAFFMTKNIGPRLGLWKRAEELIKILIENLTHWVVGYIDWNLMLDHTGGPSYINNSIDAPIILSKDKKKMYKQPLFYVMAHFSKFIPAGSTRIDAKISGCMSDKLLTAAFLQPNKKITVIIYNDELRSVGLTVNDKTKGKVNIKLEPKSINTLVYDTNCKRSKSRKKCC
ncbi:lysosomal acid glucosylceramidase-like [Contarinia nasturtii]|uniref:lysosomal acid glucosylceramidase-like n=1 Tax=Contarinia nasturtii TaxID=265458 RepID=UPI0012D43622|nr:lysosomal acid glucosylceramidase-like [Contarinia nasturtii]